MSKKSDGEKRLALHADEVFACDDEVAGRGIADINNEEEPVPSVPSSRMEEIRNECDTNFITILLAQAGFDYSSETVEKVRSVLRCKGLAVSEASVTAAYQELKNG